jgi:RES domain-containing protein
MSGRGAALYGGRFNPQGVPALYCCLSVMTAIREANQAGNLQPITLVSYDADVASVFDARDAEALASEGMDAAALAASTWRDEMKTRRDEMRTSGEARTQSFARRLIAGGYRGLLVRSFAPGTSEDDLNLVIWPRGDNSPSCLTLIDDEGRLSR